MSKRSQQTADAVADPEDNAQASDPVKPEPKSFTNEHARKYTLRDLQCRMVIAQANFNSLQQQIQQAHQALRTAQEVFQAELNKVVAEFGTDNTVLDLDAMDFKPKPPEQRQSNSPAGK